MPIFLTKKEPFKWLSTGKKTIDVRKGNPNKGETAVYLSGRQTLKMKILKTEIGCLEEIVRPDNFKLIIPSAGGVDEALAYFHGFYPDCSGAFTAYYVEPF